MRPVNGRDTLSRVVSPTRRKLCFQGSLLFRHYPHDSFWLIISAPFAKGGWKRKRMPLLVSDASKLVIVRVELNPVGMPHRELLLGVAPIGTALFRVPGPALLRVDLVELSLEIAGRDPPGVALKIAVNIVRMGLRFGKRPVEVDLLDADRPELVAHRFRPAGEIFAPLGVPIFSPDRVRPGSLHQNRCPQLLERDLVVARWKETLVGEVRNRGGHKVNLCV